MYCRHNLCILNNMRRAAQIFIEGHSMCTSVGYFIHSTFLGVSDSSVIQAVGDRLFLVPKMYVFFL